MTTYRKAGVNVKLGDVCSRLMSAAADRTLNNRRGKPGAVDVLEQKGLHRIITLKLGNTRLMLNSDGIGTKVEFAERTGCHETMAYDLFAMLCDDAVRYGFEPVAVSNILHVARLDKEVVAALARGMVKAAKDAGVAVVSGEIAELGPRVAGYGKAPYNWGGTVLSVLKKEVTGKAVKSGDTVVALKENGFRSNGLSLVRAALAKPGGSRWYKAALTPSIIYTRAVLSALADLHGIAHITGGGIPGKLGRVLHGRPFGADISDPFEPCPLMLHCQKAGGIADAEAYRTWNMGQGMLLITDRPEKVIAAVARFGIKAKAAGTISRTTGIRITSRGFFSPGKFLSF